MYIFKSLFISCIVILTIMLIIICHELGHFIAMKIIGIPVNLFVVGIGPLLCNINLGNTNYQLRLFPLGGYVQSDVDYLDWPINNQQSFFSKDKINFFFTRLFIIISGPIMNLLLSILIYFIIFNIGNPISPPILEIVNNKYNLINSNNFNIRNYQLLSINNYNIINNIDIKYVLDSINDDTLLLKMKDIHSNEVIKYEIKRSQFIKDFSLFLNKVFLYTLFLVKNIRDNINNKFLSLLVNNDQIYMINNNLLSENNNFIKLLKYKDFYKDKFITFHIIRNNKFIVKQVKYEDIYESLIKKNYINKYFTIIRRDYLYNLQLSKWSSLKYTFNQIFLLIKYIYVNFFILVTGHIRNIKRFTGPVTVFNMFRIILNKYEFLRYMSLISVLNVNLFVCNLLPFMPLDGGNIGLLLIRFLTRKKYSIIEYLYTYIGTILLFSTSLYVLYKDIIIGIQLLLFNYSRDFYKY